MSVRRFVILVVVWAVVLGLMTTPLGAIVGFLEGIAVAFFVAPLMFLFGVTQSTFSVLLLLGLGIAWAAVVLVIAGIGVWRFVRGQRDSARGYWASAISLASIAWAFVLAAESLKANWP